MLFPKSMGIDAMGRFVYASPVLPGKTDAIREHNRHKGKQVHDAAFQEAEDAFWGVLGLTGWNCWLQKIGESHYHIHCLEGVSLSRIFSGLRSLITEKNPMACKLHAYYQNVLGKDYRDPSAQPQLEQLIDVVVDTASPVQFCCGYAYPLLPGKTEAHREYTLALDPQVMAEALRPWGYRRLVKWLQRTPHGDFLVYYRESTVPLEEHKRQFQRALQSSSLHRGFEALERDTGLTRESLDPSIEFLLDHS